MNGMANACEPLINVVTNEEPKMLKGSNQKVDGQVCSSFGYCIADDDPIGGQKEPNPFVFIQRNVATPYCSEKSASKL